MKSINYINKRKKVSRFENLPTEIQLRIKQLLALNDFRAAKALYDKYLI